MVFSRPLPPDFSKNKLHLVLETWELAFHISLGESNKQYTDYEKPYHKFCKQIMALLLPYCYKSYDKSYYKILLNTKNVLYKNKKKKS